MMSGSIMPNICDSISYDILSEIPKWLYVAETAFWGEE